MANKRSTAQSTAFIVEALKFEESDKYQEALECLSQAIIYDPDNCGIYCRRGLIYENLGDKQKAHDDYQKVLQMDPDYADIKVIQGCLTLDQERFTGGCTAMILGISSDPSDPRPIWLETLSIESKKAVELRQT